MWRKITDQDLIGALSDAEEVAYRHQPFGSATQDPLPGIISQVTLEIREAIRSCENNRLSPEAETLPEGAIRHAVALIRHRLLTRYDVQNISEARLMEYREAQKYLEAVAACQRAVELPDGDEAARAPMVSPGISAPRRNFSRRQQDGI